MLKLLGTLKGINQVLWQGASKVFLGEGEGAGVEKRRDEVGIPPETQFKVLPTPARVSVVEMGHGDEMRRAKLDSKIQVFQC